MEEARSVTQEPNRCWGDTKALAMVMAWVSIGRCMGSISPTRDD